MGGSFNRSGETTRFQYSKGNNTSREYVNANEEDKKLRERDSDLVIEDNTIYEVDRDCYERLKRLKKSNKVYPSEAK